MAKKVKKRKAKKKVKAKVGKKRRRKPAKEQAAKGLQLSAAAKELNPQERQFCELYATKEEFFASGYKSYAQAYQKDLLEEGAYETCCVLASRLLRKVKILAYIDELLERQNLNDQYVDKRLGFLITQMDDRNVMLGAIREYNRKMGRIMKKFEGTVKTIVKPVMFGAPE